MTAPVEDRVQRLMVRDGISEEYARKRIGAQHNDQWFFSTKKAALAWEREFLMQKQADLNMTFESFVELYTKDIKPKLKL